MRELLWPNGAPQALASEGEQHNPSLEWFVPPAEKNAGVAVVIFPGGGYAELCDDYEGTEVAAWFNSIGITAAVCRYRLGSAGYHYPVPLLDAQQAVRLVRSHAAQYGFDPKKVGVVGFSAGGHLASLVMTRFESADSRPDFSVLAYPVIMLGSRFTHRGTQINLLGFKDRDSPEKCAYLSSDKAVSSATPPCFIYHTGADTSVPAENAVRFYTALRNNEVPSELHIFAGESHGSGLATGKLGNEHWTGLLLCWLKRMNIIAMENV